MNIDRIAREMVDVEPSVDLEARIRERLNAAPPDRGAAWWTWRIAAPIGAMAAIAVAFVVVQGPGLARRSAERGSGSRVQGPEMSAAGQGSRSLEVVSSSVTNVPTSQLANFPESQLPRIPSSQLSKPASVLSPAELAWMERRMPALDPVSALEMDHLRVDSIQPEPLAITPLTMTPVGPDGAGPERRNDR